MPATKNIHPKQRRIFKASREAKSAAVEPSSPPRLEVALDGMIDGCQIIASDFRYLYVNGTVARQGHTSKDELLGRTMMEAYPGIEKTEMFTQLKRCMRYRRLYSLENEFTYPDGRKGWFELRMEPVPAGVLIFSRDISKRKSYEEAIHIRNFKLQESNQALEKAKQALLAVMKDLKKAKDEITIEKIRDQAILESIGDGLIAIGPNGKIMMMNQAAETMLGWRVEEVRGKPLSGIPLLDADGQRIPAHKRPIYQALKHGVSTGPAFSGYYFVGKDGKQFPIGLTTTPIRLNGPIIGAIEAFRNITHEQEVDKAKTEFVSIASHQLRTPLGIAKWYLEAAKEEGYLDKLPKAAREYFDEVYKSNERVLNVVRDLLSVSRIDQGHVKDEPQKTDVAPLVRSIIQEMSLMARKKKIKLELSIKRTVPLVSIDALRLHEVIQNLIANAIQYTPESGSVHVTVNQRSEELLVSVEDTGIGISDRDQKKLFTKFFRSEEATTFHTDGSGLGLYVVKAYVEGWGGKVRVRSRQHRGSTFTVTLPFKGA